MLIQTLRTKDIDIRIFPNLTIDFVMVEALSDVRIISTEILSQAGQVVVKQAGNPRVELRGQAVGTYHLLIQTNKGPVSQILQRAGE